MLLVWENQRVWGPLWCVSMESVDAAPHQLLLSLTSHAGMHQLCWRGHSGAMLTAMPFI